LVFRIVELLVVNRTQPTQLKTDARVQKVTESQYLFPECETQSYLHTRFSHLKAMNVMRMIKLFGWESESKKEISEKRDEELVWVKKTAILNLINMNLKYVFANCASVDSLDDSHRSPQLGFANSHDDCDVCILCM
jgi:uncharacterized membrane protein